MKQYLIDRLNEHSTWAALMAVVTAFSTLDLTIDQQTAITMLAGAIFVSKG